MANPAKPSPLSVPKAAPGASGAVKVSLLCVLLFALVFGAFFVSTRNGFVNFDDDLYVTGNAEVQHGLTGHGIAWAFRAIVSSNWHPLTLLSHMADCQLYGLKPWGHHLTSVLLHAFNSVLVFLVLRRMTSGRGKPRMDTNEHESNGMKQEPVRKTKPRIPQGGTDEHVSCGGNETIWQCAFVAALFALHPLRVESVAWIAERKDVLSGFFFFLTLLAYERYARRVSSNQYSVFSDRRTRLWYLAALVFFALGLMSKPMLVTLPFVLLLLDYWPLARISLPKLQDSKTPLLHLFCEKLPFFALAAGASAVTFLIQTRSGAVVEALGLGARAQNALVSYCRYLGKLFWPADLCVFYPHTGHLPAAAVIASTALLLGLSAFVMVQWQRRPYLLVGWLWYLGTLVPVIGLVQVGGQAMADRYTYIPTIGVLLMIIWGLDDLCKRWRPGPIGLSAAGAVVSLICLALTHRQIGYWKDSETLFRHAIAVTQNNAIAHGQLATALGEKEALDEAAGEFREAIRLQPNDIIAHNNLGLLLVRQGRVDGAISQFHEALMQSPNDASTHNNLGTTLAGQGRLDEAIGEFQVALKANPNNANAHSNLGIMLAMKGRLDEAILQYKEAIRLNPDFAKAQKNLGMALVKKGQLDEAIMHLQEAVRLDPGNTDAQAKLAAARGMKH